MKIQNTSSGTYRLMGRYVWLSGAVLDIPDDIAQHVLDNQAVVDSYVQTAAKDAELPESELRNKEKPDGSF